MDKMLYFNDRLRYIAMQGSRSRYGEPIDRWGNVSPHSGCWTWPQSISALFRRTLWGMRSVIYKLGNSVTPFLPGVALEFSQSDYPIA